MKRRPTEADILLECQIKELGIPWEKEFKFHPDRKWRFDFAIESDFHRVAIEIEGAAFTSGRHTRGAGFVGDMEKYNEAAFYGWKVLRFTPRQVLDGSAIAFIGKVLGS